MTPHTRLKPGAGFPTLRPAGMRIIAAIDFAAARMGKVLTITSGSERRGRADTDPHMTGEAADVSVLGLMPMEIRNLHSMLMQILGDRFTVLLEAPPDQVPPSLSEIVYRNAKATAIHLHIQRKKGTTWPPAEAPTTLQKA